MQPAAQLVDIVEGLSVELKNDVVNLEARLAGGSVVVDHDHLGCVRILQVQRVGTLVINISYHNPQVTLCTVQQKLRKVGGQIQRVS